MRNFPAFLTPDNSDPIIFDASLKAFTKEANGTDRNGFLEGDIPPNAKFNAGHGHTFITGVVHAGATLRGRQCMFSARALSPGVQIEGGYLCVVGDTSEREAIIKTSESQDAPPILIVPEDERVRIFDFLARNNIRSDNMSTGVPERSLKALKERFPETPMTLYYYGGEIMIPSARTTNRSRL